MHEYLKKSKVLCFIISLFVNLLLYIFLLLFKDFFPHYILQVYILLLNNSTKKVFVLLICPVAQCEKT